MAISTTDNYDINLYTLISHAYADIKELGEGEELEAVKFNFAKERLNLLVQSWENYKSFQWKKNQAFLFLQKAQIKYVMGVNSNSHVTEEYNQTELTSDEAVGQTVLSITSNSNINNADNIGIQLSDGSVHWSTVVSSTATTVTIIDALEIEALTEALVWTYTTDIHKPLQVLDVRHKDSLSNIETPITIFSYEDYMRLPNKTTAAISPICYHFQKRNRNSNFYVYPAPSSSIKIIVIDYIPSFADMVLSTNNPDFPAEWYNALVKNLAVNIAPAYDKNTGEFFTNLQNDALRAFQLALSGDNEPTYIRYNVRTQ